MDDSRKYVRVAVSVLGRIQAGEYQPGDSVPAVASLAAEFGCHRRTVAAAMKLLEGQGLTTRVPGLGWRMAGQEAEDPRAYVRVTTGVRKRLASGEWQPGDPLPTIGSLAEQFGCGRLRVTIGLKPLEAEGLIVRGPNNGWWVRSGEDPRPAHARIAARLREGISNGEFKPGEDLPTIGSLAAQYGCQRQTAGKALKPLRTEGLIVFRVGLGYSVADPLPPDGKQT